MRPLLSALLRVGLAVGLACLVGCGTSAPLAPIGLDKQPANSPETVASLLATGDRTRVGGLPEPVEPQREAAATSAPNARTTPAANPFVISDFAMPNGVLSLPQSERSRLIAAAQSATIVILLVRGDHARASGTNRIRLVRRGVLVKRFLVSAGIAPRKIRIFVRSAGAFIADNGTIDGRARNRRVEIHFSEVDHGQKT